MLEERPDGGPGDKTKEMPTLETPAVTLVVASVCIGEAMPLGVPGSSGRTNKAAVLS